ncbi:MAG: hypothetical protein AAB676_09430 [Verrucomicrobiota bacterium]
MTNDLDLYRVWQNLLKPAAARNLNEDLTGDGQVTADDVTVVKGNYLSSLSMPGRASLGSLALPFASPVGDWGRLFSFRDEILGRTISLKPWDKQAEAAFFPATIQRPIPLALRWTATMSLLGTRSTAHENPNRF